MSRESTQSLEIISALIDEELNSHEQKLAVDVLLGSYELRSHWRKQQLIRELFQNGGHSSLHYSFSKQLMMKLADEPTLLVPSDVSRKQSVSQKWLSPPYMGIAASLVLAITVVVYITPDDSPQQIIATNAVHPIQQPRLTIDPDALAAIEHQRMEGYMARHAAKNTGVQIRGFLPYARVVSYSGGNN
jgi:negative regulator of sigma E activity